MMQKFVYLIINKLGCFLCLCFLSLVVNAQDTDIKITEEPVMAQESSSWTTLKKVWHEDIQFHGFFSQGLFHTSGNNVYGNSKNSVSAGLTELGVNVSYQALNNLSFAVQGLYRRAGESTGDWGEASLDYAFFDYTFFNSSAVRMGLRGGRVKNPWGFYNETRDVASTHPTIFLPLVYFDRSRALFLSLDGGQVYADHNSSVGNFSYKLNFGLMNADDDELLMAVTFDPTVSGQLKGEPSLVTQLAYESTGGLYAIAFSYAHANVSYTPGNTLDPYTGLQLKFNSFILSTQYNGEKFSLVGEYALQWNQFAGITLIRPDSEPISEYWYVQAGYRILDNLQVTLRYDSSVQDIHDRSGRTFHQQTGLPAHLMFTKDIVVGLRWDITPAWMVRAEYQRVHGASVVSGLDNTNIPERARDWNIYALQVAYRF